jgi:L-fucose mutarotase
MPLDTYVKTPVSLMDNGDKENRPPIWDEYKKIIEKNEGEKDIELIERFAFYTRAKNAYAIIATGETAIYANVILQKGVVIE